MPQSIFGIDVEPSYRESDFLKSDCNRTARTALGDVWAWPQGRFVLTGPAKSGKTHLARIWTAHNEAVLCRARDLGGPDSGSVPKPVAIEDVHEIAGDGRLEQVLFDLVNRFAASGRLLLMTGCGQPRDWGLAMPDLASRMTGSRMAEILPPNNDLVHGLVLKQFSDRQVAVSPETLRYLASRCARSYEAIHAAVMALDSLSLAERKRITRTQIDAYFANGMENGH